MNRKLLTTLVIGVLTLGILAGCGAPAAATNPQNVRMISASGSGKVYLVPDVAYIYIGVYTEAEGVGDALNKNNEQANAVAEAIKGFGIEGKDIQTSSFNVYPQQRYDPQTGQVTGTYYSVDNTVYVTVRKLADLSKILDAVVRSGANSINGITFDVQDKTAALNQARDEAIAAARLEAEGIAKAAGVTLGNLINVSAYNSGSPTPVYEGKGGGMAAAASDVPIAAGQLLILVDASVSYEIK